MLAIYNLEFLKTCNDMDLQTKRRKLTSRLEHFFTIVGIFGGFIIGAMEWILSYYFGDQSEMGHPVIYIGYFVLFVLPGTAILIYLLHRFNEIPPSALVKIDKLADDYSTIKLYLVEIMANRTCLIILDKIHIEMLASNEAWQQKINKDDQVLATFYKKYRSTSKNERIQGA